MTCKSHFWLVESPNGPTSIGRCRYCGAVKELANSPHAAGFTYMVYPARSRTQFDLDFNAVYQENIKHRGK